MKRKLASIQRITEINPIENAESIMVATVLGWKVVIRKEEFKIGDLCVYFEIDSILPEIEEFEFLKSNKYRLKTARMRGQLSQGLCWNINILPKELEIGEGLNVTDILGVKKYEVEIPFDMSGKSKGSHPSIVRRSGEERVQSSPELLKEFSGMLVADTTKVEGVSSSFIHNKGEVDVCSHNHSLIEDKSSLQWQMNYKYDIINKLKEVGNIAIQGEIAGPGIYGNPMGLPDKQLFIFRITDLNNHKRFNPHQIIEFCNRHELQHVPMKLDVKLPEELTVEYLLELAKGEYELSGTPREGSVLIPMQRVYSEYLCDWLSMKVINNEYLLGEWKKKRRK